MFDLIVKVDPFPECMMITLGRLLDISSEFCIIANLYFWQILEIINFGFNIFPEASMLIICLLYCIASLEIHRPSHSFYRNMSNVFFLRNSKIWSLTIFYRIINFGAAHVQLSSSGTYPQTSLQSDMSSYLGFYCFKITNALLHVFH